jgi:hypothetical protein
VRPVRGSRAEQQPSETSEKLVVVDRLGEVAVGPDQQRRDSIVRGDPLGRDHDHRQILAVSLAELVTDLEPVHVRQLDLEHDCAGWCRRECERFLASASLDCGQPRAPQHAHDPSAKYVVAVDDQYRPVPLLRHRPLPRRSLHERL